MSEQFEIQAILREDQGKGASRRLRREGQVPAVLYGGNQEPTSISIAHKELQKALENEAFYSHVLTINLNGKKESAILKDLQRHPYKPTLSHADFQRVNKDTEIHVHVPLHFTNEDICAGVKTAGGVASHQITDVEVICLPGDLPEFIEVDMTDVQLDQILHLSDLKLPKGVRIAALQQGEDHDLPVVSIHKPKGAKSDDAAEGGEESESEA
ncbi:50S ribosomal protein L25/general stress protein Ctc [Mangrovitalea sediminis]|uniref:50S ribosomal protein L25/general stress protein Ctc n=1 Tax=Mangrovitalea sediminis TaxID=1982043 RepID=UPI000BE50845|nr:50S ribosomal protein L25/general stress protein Ctc [Mangrovitalea sediminis]